MKTKECTDIGENALPIHEKSPSFMCERKKSTESDATRDSNILSLVFSEGVTLVFSLRIPVPHSLSGPSHYFCATSCIKKEEAAHACYFFQQTGPSPKPMPII